MYPPSLLSYGIENVKKHIVETLESGIDDVLGMAISGAGQRAMEERIWDAVLSSAQVLMSCALSHQCLKATESDIAARGLEDDQVRLRNESDYWMTLTTTFGPVSFFSFAYRDSSSGVTTVTRTPAREEVFPLHQHCRSSELCLEWETRLGCEMPFRHAQQGLTYFTHGAVTMEDTTIASHLLTVSHLVDRSWLYQEHEKIREVLRERATRDLETGKPIIYFSTDAHALRRYVDDTWDAAWKMANGLRMWCVDRRNGAIIHLGGEFTWGDCNIVAEIIDWLVDSGHVPADGDYGEGVVASIAVVIDGMPWFEDHVVPKFTTPVVILDAYHAMERLQDYANARFGKGSEQARKYYDNCIRLLLGRRPKKRSKPRKKGSVEINNVEENPVESVPPWLVWSSSDQCSSAVEVLIEMLSFEVVNIYDEDDRDDLVEYLTKNAYRMHYRRFRALGYQIGSGAMESLHRTGSQKRLKIPGARWLPETSQALFDLRMLFLCGRWEEFWHQESLHNMLIEAFSRRGEMRKKNDDDKHDGEVYDEAA